jgi:hypothetical protein
MRYVDMPEDGQFSSSDDAVDHCQFASTKDGDAVDQWFTCSCSTSEHVFRVSFFRSDDPLDRELFVSVFLQEFGFFRRCWEALKYALGYKCRYGHWEEILIKDDDVGRLINLLRLARGSVPEGGQQRAHDVDGSGKAVQQDLPV